jgi:thiol:disulfide interchange protein DsbD
MDVKMNKVVLGLGILLLVLIVFVAVMSQSLREKSVTASSNVSSSSESKWNTDLNAALQEAKKSNKTVFVDFYADWCPYCRELDEKTFSDPQVQQKLVQNYIMVKINVDQNPTPSSEYKVYSLPTLLVLSADGQEIRRIEGYQAPVQLLSQI